MIDPKEAVESSRIKEWKESTARVHDRFNFESKIDYTLEKTSKSKISYLLDTYFFIPEALHINEDTYSKKQFFSDINNRIRFKTPKMSIDGISDEKNNLSPLATVKRNLKKLEYGNTSKVLLTEIHRELRLYACIVKVSLRDQFSYIVNECKNQTDANHSLKSYLDSIEKLQANIESVGKEFMKVQIPFKLREAFQFVEEYVSLLIDTWVTRALNNKNSGFDPNFRNQMINIIETEHDHRKRLDSRLILKENEDNESYSYFEGILKKYVQGVLYLEKKKKDPKSSTLEVFYSISAGLAMFFSLLFGFLILSQFEMYSIPFIMTTVVIYIMKDRIKDNVRNASQKAVGLMFPDQRIDIVDGFNEEKIGMSKETVRFIEREKMPLEILKIRRSSNQSPLEEMGKPEVVLLYKKKIILFRKKIEAMHTRRKDFSDVVRFNIRRFLSYADDPNQFALKWNSKIEKIPVSKVYHINLVYKLSSFKGGRLKKVFYKKYRIIIDQRGMKRVLEPEIIL